MTDRFLSHAVATLISPRKVFSLQKLGLSGELLTPEVRDEWANMVVLINL